MGLVIDYYLEKGAEKGQQISHILSDRWSESSLKSALETASSFQYLEDQRIEHEGETYRIKERRPLQTMISGEETYTAERLFEGPEGDFHPSYETKTVKGGQIT